MSSERRRAFRRGLRDGALIMPAIGAFGLAYGTLAVEAGLSRELTILASLIVVSGAAQFTMVGLLAAGAGPVLVATTGLALRHLPMSARLAAIVGPRRPLVWAGLAWVLVDETFGLTLHASERGEPDPVSYKFAADLTLYGTWVATGAIGTFLGDAVDPDTWGADVFFPLMFLALAAPLVRTRRDWLVAGAAAVAALAATYVLPDAWRITGAAAVAAAGGALLRPEPGRVDA